tara:strand:+ start:268 stop:588 length:321 start_codon:yes stop_codon:yes gene_type:complete
LRDLGEYVNKDSPDLGPRLRLRFGQLKLQRLDLELQQKVRSVAELDACREMRDEIPSATSAFESLPWRYAILRSTAVVAEVRSNGVPAADIRARSRMASKAALGKA